MSSLLSHRQLHDRLATTFASAILASTEPVGDPFLELDAAHLLDICRFLKSEPDLAFDTLSNLTGVDYFEPDPKLAAKFPVEPRVEVVYHLFSFTHRHRLVLKVRLPRWRDDVPGQLPRLDSLSSVWPIAVWHERECFDLVGVEFVGHPGLTRILCPDDWVGHPLRKDYEMPLEYHGIRGR